MALRETEYCRWHKIVFEFHRDYHHIPIVIPKIGFNVSLLAIAYSIQSFLEMPSLIWLLSIMFIIGISFGLFSDMVIVLDFPFSRWIFWGMLTALGVTLSTISIIIAMINILFTPSDLHILIRQALNEESASKLFIQLIFAILMLIPLAISGKLLFSRVMFFELPFASFLWMSMYGLIITRFGAEIEKANDIFVHLIIGLFTLISLFISSHLTLAISRKTHYLVTFMFVFNLYFISQGIYLTFNTGTPPNHAIEAGNYLSLNELISNINWVSVIKFILAYVLCFELCEKINIGLRGRYCDITTFKATIWPSFPSCTLSPVAGIVVSNQLLAELSTSNLVLFFLFTVIISAILCVLSTRLIIALYS